MDPKTFKTAAYTAIDDIISYFTNISDQRVTPSIKPGYLKPQLPDTAPQEPQPYTSFMGDIKKYIMPGLTHWQHPRFMAFFPASLSYPSILGELYSAAFTAPAFNWLCSPACTELETIVLDWVGKMLDLPPLFLSDSPTGGGGVIQGSASEAVVVVMVAARERHVRRILESEGLLPEAPNEPEETLMKREDRAAEIRGKLVALGSEQAHSSTQKGASIAGVRYRSIRAGAETGFRLTGANLRKRIRELKDQDLEPFYLTTCLGTTGTCAVDDFGDIADVRDQEAPGMWVHVDAAYAGAALICPEYREQSGAKHMEKMDSFDVNLHKWLLVNFDASCLFVRDRRDLTKALGITPSYLQNPDAISALVTDYRDWQIPLGRRFRALKIWFVLRAHGVEGLQNYVREHVRLGKLFAELCKSEKGREAGIEIMSGPAYALTVVRVLAHAHGKPKAVANGRTSLQNGINPADEMNALGTAKAASDADNTFTKRVYERINADGEFFLTSFVTDGAYAIRVVSANPNAQETYVRRCFDVLLEAIHNERQTSR